MSEKSNLFNISVLLRSVWCFPAILVFVLLVLSALRISGTSVGIYYPILYGKAKNPALIANHPQPVRSDEWLVTTQLTIAQKAAGYPRVNPNVDGGSDMSVVGDAPYKGWSEAFKPQNLAFLVLPFENAFAFKWWLLLVLVIVSCYFFVLKLLPGKRLLASLIGIAVGFSPFLFWWYSSGTMAPIFYGFFIILISMRIIDNEKIKWLRQYPEKYSQFIYVAALSYLLVAFALILYPPFQITVALCVVAFLLGYLLEKYGAGRRLFSKAALKQYGLFGMSLIIAGVLVMTFVSTRSQAVSAIQKSAYPGSRQFTGGGMSLYEIFSTQLQPQLERPDRAGHYFTNQSEASNFILFLPFLLVPAFVVLYLEHKQRGRLRWSLLLVQLVGVLFLMNLFVGGFQPFYKLFLLNNVEHQRLFIGLGFLEVLQLTLLIKSLDNLRLSKTWLTIGVGLYSALCLLALFWDTIYVHKHWPLFVSSGLAGLYSLIFLSIITLVLIRRYIWAASIFMICSLLCVYAIHPLYVGLEPVYPSKLIATIDRVSPQRSTWATIDDGYFENSASMASRSSLSGIQPYPNIALWKQVEGPGASYIYNRYAHILFSSDPATPSKLRLAEFDSFHVKFECSPFIKQHVQYALATHTINNACADLVSEVKYPAVTFYLYKIH